MMWVPRKQLGTEKLEITDVGGQQVLVAAVTRAYAGYCVIVPRVSPIPRPLLETFGLEEQQEARWCVRTELSCDKGCTVMNGDVELCRGTRRTHY